MIFPAVTETELLHWVTSVMWPFVRISALFLAAPMFGARAVPMRVRLGLALILAFVVAPSLSGTGIDPLSLPGALTAAREALIGAVMGFLLQMLFGALSMGGEIVALAAGLAFARASDPNHGGNVSLLGQYFVIFATLLFFAFDGHLALMSLLFDSFQLLPPAATGFNAGSLWNVAMWGGEMFKGAVLVALPAAAALLLASIAMGVIARSAPQLNIFAVGFPVTLLLGLVLLAVSLPLLAPQFETLMNHLLTYTRETLVAAQ